MRFNPFSSNSGMVSGAGESSQMTSSERGKKKNRRFCGKVKEIDSLGVRKAIDKKKKYVWRQKKVDVFNLSSLSDCLPKLKVPDQPFMFVLQVTWKSKKKLILKKRSQLGSLLYHHAYEPHPLASIHQPLQNRQCIYKRGQVQVTNFGKQVRRNRRIKKSIASYGPYQAMEC